MSKKKEYPKLSGAAGIHGSDYQIKLLTLFMLQSYQKGNEFWLSTENKHGGKFDDVVLETNEKTVLLQAKHKEDPKDKKQHIAFNDIFPTGSKDEFNVYKYFDSFLNVKDNFKCINAVILCTNTQITKDKKNDIYKYIYPEMIDEDNIFYFSESKFCYILNQSCKQLFSATHSETDIDSFLDKFQLVCIDDNNVDAEILKLIKNIDMFNEPFTLENVANFLFKEVKNWFMGKKGCYLTSQDVEAYIASFKTENFITDLKKYNVQFKSWVNTDRYSCFVVLKREHILLQTLNIYQNTCESEILIINPDDDLNTQKKLVSSFKLPKFVLLVVPIVQESYQDLQKTIINVLGVTSEKVYKKVVFVTDIDTLNFAGFYPNRHQVNINFKIFSEETQNIIFSKKVTFQEKEVSLRNLINPDNFDKMDEIVDDSMLVKLIKNEKVVINLFYENNIIDFYVPRKIQHENSDSTNFLGPFLSEEQLCNVIVDETKNKIILISNSPGMGKTTILSSLQYLLNSKYNNWIIKINLNECTKIFKNCLVNKSSITLEELLTSLKMPLTEKFEINFFNLPGKVIIMFDAVDEISPDYTDLVIDLLLTCKSRKNIRKILITSRPHCRNKVVESTDCFTYSLEPFSDEDKIRFLGSYWTKIHNISSGTNEMKCKIFAKILSEHLDNVIGPSSWSLIAIPLQTRLVAEVFESKCMEYIGTDEFFNIFPENFNTAKLYELFIEKRKKIYIDEKNHAQGIIEVQNILNKMFDNAITEHTRMALKLIFEVNELKYFKIMNVSENVSEASLLRMGILQKNDTVLRFTHQTFAEYFVALNIWKTLNEADVHKDFISFLIETILSNSKYNTVHSFIESILEYQVISDKILEQCGKVTEKIKWDNKDDIIFLAKYNRYNILKLMLEKCNNCSGIFNTNNSQEDLLFYGLFDLSIFKLLLNKGADIYRMYSQNRTLLHWAATGSSEEVVEILIKKGLNINAKDLRGQSPLYCAAQYNLVKTVKLLILNGVEINIVDENNTSVLHCAAQFDSLNIVPILVENGISIDIKDKKGLTPLLTACFYKSFMLAGYLIDQGCEIAVTDYEGKNSLHYLAIENYCGFYLTRPRICIRDKPVVTKVLMENGTNFYADNEDIRLKIKAELVPLYEELGKKILEKNEVDVNGVSKDGMTPLHHAAATNNLGIAKCLAIAGADVAIKNADGETPLHLAAEKNLFNMLETLVFEKSHIDVRNNNDESILHTAAKNDSIDVLKYLVNNETLYFLDRNKFTPLLTACYYKSFGCAKYLIACGSDTTAVNNEGCNALHLLALDNFCDLYLRYMKYKPVIYKIIDEHNIGLNNDKVPFLVKAELKPFYKEIFDKLITLNSVDINAVCKKGMTALHYAVISGNYVIINCLLDRYADKTVKNKKGLTPCDIANNIGDLKAQEILS